VTGSLLPPCAWRRCDPSCAARCSLSTPPSTDANRGKDPLVRFGLLQGATRSCLAPARRRKRLSWSSVPYSTVRCASYSPEVPPSSTAHVHGFSPSSRASFRHILSGLVSSRKRSWGSPYRGFPSNGGLGIRHSEVTLMSFPRWPPRPSSEGLGPLCEGLGRLQGLALRSSPFAVPQPVKVATRPFPSWVSSSLGVCHRR
jgi:hypothetical protein